jgi:hypothetical protein
MLTMKLSFPFSIQGIVPTRIYEFGRIIVDIAVPIQRLRIPRLRHDGIRLDEAPYHGIIPPTLVEVQIGVILDALAGVAIGGVQRAGRIAIQPEGHVTLLALRRST